MTADPKRMPITTRNAQAARAQLDEADAARSDARTPEESTAARAFWERARLDWDLMVERAS